MYTAIFGGVDILKEPRWLAAGVEYVCFGDADVPAYSEQWQIVPVNHLPADPRRSARFLKLMPHLLFPTVECSVWIDGSFTAEAALEDLVNKVSPQAPIACFHHPRRDCAYQEAVECGRLDLDDRNVIRQQMARYSRMGYPRRNGLIASGIMVRWHQDPAIQRLMDAWWTEIDTGSVRDQLSFNYCAWMANMDYCEIRDNIYDNRYCTLTPHERFVRFDMAGRERPTRSWRATPPTCGRHSGAEWVRSGARRVGKIFANTVFGSIGLELRRKAPPKHEPQPQPGYEPPWSALEAVLSGALAAKGHLNILQIGANDGLINDPIYGFVMRHRSRTRIVLCEPQDNIVEHLRRNYQRHPSHYVFLGAVGSAEGFLVLHRVRPEAWDALSVPHLADAPAYRAPSGVTSADRDHVRRFLSRYSRSSTIDDEIEAFEVRCTTPRGVLSEAGLFSEPDVVQIDTEGLDDEIAYALDPLPPILNLETGLLTEERNRKLREHLEEHGFHLVQGTPEGLLAVRLQ